jgi:hypothetical protein
MFRHILRENIDFVQYYNAGLCHLYKIYFVREANLLSMSKNSAHQLTDGKLEEEIENEFGSGMFGGECPCQ